MCNLLNIGKKYFNQGLEEYIEWDDLDAALKSFFAAAATGYEPAYREIVTILLEIEDDSDSTEI